MKRARRLTQAAVADSVAMALWALAFVVIAMAAFGCARQPLPRVETKIVQVPVVKPCVRADVPPAPGSYADDALAALADPVERLKAIGAANQQRRARLAVVEPVLASCR